MEFKQAFLLAVKSLKTSKMRSFLTMLGIIIGVAAVIVLVSLINGYANSMTETFESLGTNLISVNIFGRSSNRTVTPSQIQDFADENVDLFAGVSPVVTVSATVKSGDTNDSISCYGVSETYDIIKNYEVQSGRFLQYIDVERRQNVTVIGTYIAQEFFEGEDPVGKIIKLNGRNFTVVGLLEEKADSTDGSDDDLIIIPYTQATGLSGNARISSYAFSAADTDTMDEAMSKIEDFLLDIYGDDSAYRVFNQAEMMEMVDELTGTLSTVLIGIAAISLLVGGIGIMNIMLVSVTERTREIGIRKSLGAKRKDIMRQFLIEAATTSAAGGIVGIIVGIVLAIIGGKLMDLNASPSFNAIVIAFSVSVGIGVAFGYFPAGKAAKLNPIDALKYD